MYLVAFQLGSNVIMAVSIAVCKAAAYAVKTPIYRVCCFPVLEIRVDETLLILCDVANTPDESLYQCLDAPMMQHIAELAGYKNVCLPVPANVVINGGSLEENKLAIRVCVSGALSIFAF